MQKEKFVKIMSILMIICASIAIFISLMSFLGAMILTTLDQAYPRLLQDLAEEYTDGLPLNELESIDLENIATDLIWTGSIGLICAAAELTGGIIGIRNYNDREKLKPCIGLSVVAMAASVLSLFLWPSYSETSITFVVPLLMIIAVSVFINSEKESE